MSASLRGEALRFARRDDWKSGRLFFEDAVRRDPGRAEAHAHLGFFCVKETRFDTARGLAEFAAALALDPGCAVAHAYRAIALGSLLRRAEADAALAAAERAGAAPADLALARGSVELEAGSVDEAVAQFRRLVELEKDGSGRILLTQALIQGGRNAEALDCARAAFAADPTDFRAAVYGGIALVYLARLAEARAELARALPLGADYPLLHHTLAYAAQKEGDAAAAERHARECLHRDPDYVTSRKLLGDLCAASGRAAEAREHYAAALRLFPDYAEARDALRRLA
jgi:tetratricopeptide (TPR) repeat protein